MSRRLSGAALSAHLRKQQRDRAHALAETNAE